jgi:3-hydroxybutyryl-CoA dehydrogenase
MTEIKTIGVVGAGTMGHGISQVAATSGFDVRLVDVVPAALESGLGKMGKSLDRLVAKERLTAADREAALARVEGSTELAALADMDLVVEAVVEKLEIKQQVLSELDRICAPQCILATNTSSISITRLAAATSRPEQVIGMHFMNPVPMINEAIFCLHEGVGEAAAIDEVMKLGMNHPMGPLALADLIGLDVCLDILNVLYREFKAPKFRACPLLVKTVDAGRLGRKSGRGFYEYA